MNPAMVDWTALERLRGVFLDGTAGAGDYWQSETDLASYDATFAQRIGWKWDYVLAELQRRGWTPPGGQLLDWGCGSGIAARAFLDQYGAGAVSGLWLWDRSRLAMDFAARRAREKYPGLPVSPGLAPSTNQPGEFILLLSHVLGELNPVELDDLLSLAARSACLLWVEPGTHAVSRALCAARERLLGSVHDSTIAHRNHEPDVRGRTSLASSSGNEEGAVPPPRLAGMQAVAPCTHQQPCGMLAPANARHWCHHFAAPPPGVFTDGDWARFATFVGIDLRSLPLSYLVMDQRPVVPLPPEATRVIGRPRIHKGHSRLFCCDASGVHDRTLGQRAFPEIFRTLRKGHAPTLLKLRCENAKIVQATAFAEPPSNRAAPPSS